MSRMPFDDVARLLAPDERALAVRWSVALDRRHPCRQPGLRGDLHLTDRRLLLVGPHPVEIALETIVDAAVVDDRLLLMLRSGSAITIAAEDPLRLRKEISAARAAGRADRGTDARRRVAQSSEA